MSESVQIIRRGIKRQITTTIPAQDVIEEVEVDTLQEFLKDVRLTEEQVRIACKAYSDDKVTQPTYKMEDLLKVIEAGKEKAKQYLSSNFKEATVTISDAHVVDALLQSKQWKCTSKAKGQYSLERT